MSRSEKKQLQKEANADDVVRLFAYTNRTRGYCEVFQPAAPVIVLRAKLWKEGDKPPYEQWLPLAEKVFARRPATEAMYLLDASRLTTLMEAEETSEHAGCGPMAKRAWKLLVRLNPDSGVLVAAGPTAVLAAKLVLFPMADQLLEHLVLFCPGPPGDVPRFIAKAKAPVPGLRVTILTNDKAAGAEWTKVLGATFAVAVVLLGPKVQPFAHLASLSVEAGTAAPTNRQEEMRVFSVAFERSTFTKQLQQIITRVTGDEDGVSSDDDADDDEDGAPPAQASGGLRCVDLCELPTVTGCRTKVAGIALADGRVGNAHGIVAIRGFARTEGDTVEVEAHVGVEDGRIVLRDPATRSCDPKTPLIVAPSKVPPVNHSAPQRSYGVVLLRGRKCAVGRSLSGEYRGMRFPSALLQEGEAPMQCATRALCRCFDVTRSTFAIRSDLPAVVSYRGGEVATLFIAFATAAPKGGVTRDRVEEAPEPNDPYDWMTAPQAAQHLVKADAAVLSTVVAAVASAEEAGVLHRQWGFGRFGDAAEGTQPNVVFVHSPLGAPLGLAALPEGAVVVEADTSTKRGLKPIAAAFEAGAALVAVPLPQDVDVERVMVEFAPTVTAKTWALPRLLCILPADPALLAPANEAAICGHLSLTGHVFKAVEHADVVCLPEDAADHRALVALINESARLAPAPAAALSFFAGGAPLPKVVASSPAVHRVTLEHSGVDIVPLHAARLAAWAADVEQLRSCGVVFVTGVCFVATVHHHGFDCSMAAGRITVRPGTAWEAQPRHDLIVVVAGDDATVGRCQASLKSLICVSPEEAETEPAPNTFAE